MFKFRCLLALAFLGSITLVPVPSWANAIHLDPPSICDAVAGNLVKNCGFETGDFSGWTPTPAASDGTFFVSTFAPHSGNFQALFAAFGFTDDSISQVLSTTAGRSFDLSFFLQIFQGAPAGEADFSASWDGSKVFSAPASAFGVGYTQFSFVVPGTGRDTLQFAGRNALGSGSAYFLDDVEVTPTVVPEPGTLSLFGLGLLLGGALLARRKKLLDGVQA